MAEFLSLHDAVARNLHSGDIVAFEGFTHLIPHAAAHHGHRAGSGDPQALRAPWPIAIALERAG